MEITTEIRFDDFARVRLKSVRKCYSVVQGLQYGTVR